MVHDPPAHGAIVVLVLDADAPALELDFPRDDDLVVVILEAFPIDELATRCLPTAEAALGLQGCSGGCYFDCVYGGCRASGSSRGQFTPSVAPRKVGLLAPMAPFIRTGHHAPIARLRARQPLVYPALVR